MIAGTYRIVRLLGRGGMGEVFEVRHERTKAASALKLLLPDWSDAGDIVTRFRREAEVTSTLNHPNIVRVFDFDVLPGGRPYLAMELLQGEELTSRIGNGTGMPPATVLSVVEQIGLGLMAAHEKGIVHRDLKPSNIFLVPLPGANRDLVKILDFGISKVRDATTKLTQTATIMGTPNYMSPEQATGRGDDIGAASDQFALAAITYEMLTGRMAFPGDQAMAILFKVVHEPAPTFADAGCALPAGLEAVVRRALEKNKEDRFPSVSHFVRAFDREIRRITNLELRETEEALESTLAAPGSTPSRSASNVPVTPVTTLRGSAGQITPDGSPPFAGRAETTMQVRRRRSFLVRGAAGAAFAVVAIVFIATRGGPTPDRPAERTAATGGGRMIEAPIAPKVVPPAPPASTPPAVTHPPAAAEGAPGLAPNAESPAKAHVTSDAGKKPAPVRTRGGNTPKSKRTAPALVPQRTTDKSRRPRNEDL